MNSAVGSKKSPLIVYAAEVAIEVAIERCHHDLPSYAGRQSTTKYVFSNVAAKFQEGEMKEIHPLNFPYRFL
jgi:hypothetical protein